MIDSSFILNSKYLACQQKTHIYQIDKGFFMWINILETPDDSEIDAQKYRQLVPSEKIIYSQTRAVNKLHLSIIVHASVSIVYM